MMIQEDTLKTSGKINKLNLRLLYSQTLNYMPGSILPAFISLASAAIFTRVFSANDYGQYCLILSITTFIVTISCQWLQQAINRYLPAAISDEEQKSIKQMATAGLALILILVSTSGVLISVIGLIAFSPQWAHFLLPTTVFVIGMSIFNPVGVVLQAQMKARTFSCFNLANAAGKLIFSLVIVFMLKRDPAGLMWGSALSVILLLPILWRKADMPSVFKLKFSDWHFYWAGIKQFAHYGFPMIGWFLSATLLSVGDRYVIQLFRGSAEVGIYSANYTLISGAVGLIAGPVLLAAHPFFMRAWGSGDIESTGRWLGRIAELFLQFGIMLVGATWLFSSDIASWFLGKEFRLGHTVMPIVVAGIVMWQLGMYAHKPLEFAERTKLMFCLSIAVAALNLVLNIIFVPEFGYLAAAYTTTISYSVYTIVTSIVGQRLLRWRINARPIFITTVITIATTLVVAFLRPHIEHMWGYTPGFVVAFGVFAVIAVVIALCIIDLKLGKIAQSFKNPLS